jgi:hypothetical protein
MQWELTAIFRPVDGGFVARTKELPDIAAQGVTLDEARENLRATVWQTILSRRTQAKHELAGSSFVEETMTITRESRGAGYQFTNPST